MRRRHLVSRETKMAAQSRRRGLPPGTLLDSQAGPPASLRLLQYGVESYAEIPEPSIEKAAASIAGQAGVTWLHLQGVPQRSQLEELGQHLQIHPLTLEDIQSGFHQAKLEIFDNYLYLRYEVLHSHGEEIDVHPFHILLQEGLVISVATGRYDITESLLPRLQSAQSRLRQRSASYLLYALLDLVVDQAFPALQHFTERVERLEEDLLLHTHKDQLAAIQQTKRDLLLFNHALWPMQETVSRLSHSIGEHPLLRPTLRPFLNDLYDHTIQLMSLLNSERDVVGGLMDIYLSMVNNRLSDIMRILTIISTIFIPLTFITGIYGMNIDGIPLLHYRYGYDIVVGFMWLVAVAMLSYFRRRGWIFQGQGKGK